MFRVRGILPQTFLVIVASFVLVTFDQVDAAYISFYPPANEWAPPTIAVGGTIECTANESPYKLLKWFNNFDWKLVSKGSVLVVTEEMRHWKQPITLLCKAYYERYPDDPKIQGRYPFRVANASSEAVAMEVPVNSIVAGTEVKSLDDDGDDEEEYDDKYGDKYAKLEQGDFGQIDRISFNPPSSVLYPTTLAVGASIECIADVTSYPSFKWYDINWNTVSWSSAVYVTEDMRHWPQPITLRCEAQNSRPLRGVEDFYTFQVANASSGTGPEAWVIAVAVIVPIVVLAAIAIAVFFIIRQLTGEKKKMAATKTKPTNGSTAALLLQY